MFCLPVVTPICTMCFTAYASDFSTVSVFAHSRDLIIIKDVRAILPIYPVIKSYLSIMSRRRIMGYKYVHSVPLDANT